jgi:oxygen-independent coproporphyrinogen-3 oxidase
MGRPTGPGSRWPGYLSQNGDLGLVEETPQGRWLIRTIAAVFNPSQRQRASGSRLI